MKAQGQKFNSEQHEALTTQETDELEPNHVLTVLQAGYMMKDRVLRHAKVIVQKEISKSLEILRSNRTFALNQK